MIYRRGAEFESTAWPPVGKCEAVNEATSRILEYLERRLVKPWRPANPFDLRHGRIVLLERCMPYDVNDPLQASKVAVPVADELPGIPRYLIDEADEDRRGRKIEGLTEIAYLLWPSPLLGVTPANDVARQVMNYLEANAGHPLLGGAPWDWFTRSVFLPDLPEVQLPPDAIAAMSSGQRAETRSRRARAAPVGRRT